MSGKETRLPLLKKEMARGRNLAKGKVRIARAGVGVH